jgi:hypothetical protein
VKGAHIIRPLKELAGVYSNNAYGSFEVKVINDSLFSLLGKDTMYLRHYSYDIFQSLGYKAGKGADTTSDSPGKILFQMDDNADIVAASMQLDLTDPVIFKKRDKGTQLSKETLSRYAGEYTISDMKLKVYLEGEGQLRFFVPGQQLYTLIPQEEHKFKIQELKGYSLEFLVDDKGTVTGLISVQPNGRFTAKRSQ